MKKVFLLLGILSLSVFSCDPDLSRHHDGYWYIKNRSDETVVLYGYRNSDNIWHTTLTPNDSLLFHSARMDLDSTDLFNYVNHKRTDSVELFVNEKKVVTWRKSEKDSGARNFFRESSWECRKRLIYDRYYEYVWTFVITNSDID